uniref:Uncharacterized protein n=1 Tax=Oryza sativa subsp. japonica TaxID=39947 RepID=Q6YSU9_ORYSJ|nr:hypothetical protein [Oryza sativa Japonica Group]
MPVTATPPRSHRGAAAAASLRTPVTAAPPLFLATSIYASLSVAATKHWLIKPLPLSVLSAKGGEVDHHEASIEALYASLGQRRRDPWPPVVTSPLTSSSSSPVVRSWIDRSRPSVVDRIDLGRPFS